MRGITGRFLIAACIAAAAVCAQAAELGDEHFKPVVGQQGRDVVWVPTPLPLVEKMLDVAGVTPRDYVMDLGSGDGRNVIAAAKRGARALGVEYDSEMVELSRRSAERQGVGERAQFVQGDMYEADISQATVMALFLLPQNLDKLVPKFLALKPGTRIVANHFGVDGWTPDDTGRIEGDCNAWCTWLLYIVPAPVAGKWRLAGGEIEFEQKFQVLKGTYRSGTGRLAVDTPTLRGDRITFTVGDRTYVGRVAGDEMTGDGGAWKATRLK